MKTAVVYWSGTGHTEAMAQAVAGAAGADVFTASEFSADQVAEYDAIAFGDGEWMRNWEADCAAAGAVLVADPVICQDEPNDEAITQCEALGAALKG